MGTHGSGGVGLGPARSEKLAAVGLLAAGVMHEINNPLTSILAYAQFLLRAQLSPEQRTDVERIAAEALRASRIVQNLLTFARPMRPNRIPMDLNCTVDRALDARRDELARDNIVVRTALCPDLPTIEADGNQIEQVFINIINNARDAMIERPDRGCLTVSTHARDGHVCVTFDDTGPGISDDNIGHIFDPFFTTKDAGSGTGLGLAVCYGIVAEHRGHISARNLPHGGARLKVELPTTNET